MKEMETPGLQAVFDRTRADPKRQHLSPSDHSMLPSSQSGEQIVGCGWLTRIIAVK